MPQKIIAQGAEAKIILENNSIIKDRIPKSYRLKELDDKIRKRRTKSETKLLLKASKIIPVPIPTPQETKGNTKILMPYIEGKKLSENLNKFPLNKQKQILKQIGISVAKLHDEDIIHGDLTTSNMILSKDKIYFIDFGLGYFNGKYEDKAVDIHLLKQALEAKHFENWKEIYNSFLEGYKQSKNYEKTLNRLEKVEKRGRYKH